MHGGRDILEDEETLDGRLQVAQVRDAGTAELIVVARGQARDSHGRVG